MDILGLLHRKGRSDMVQSHRLGHALNPVSACILSPGAFSIAGNPHATVVVSGHETEVGGYGNGTRDLESLEVYDAHSIFMYIIVTSAVGDEKIIA